MKPKTMILMVVAVACGLVASYMTSRLLAERNKAPAEEKTVSVLWTRQKVQPWQAIKDPEKYFEVKEVREADAPRRALHSLAQVKDQRLNKTIGEGKPVTEDDLLSKDQEKVEHMLQPGQRAVAIKVNAESSIAGLIGPGSRVDVTVTLRGNKSEAKIILQDMLVLAVDANIHRDPAAPSMLGQTVTLAATPEEATKLALAASAGELRLLLRGIGDKAVVSRRVTRMEDLDRSVVKDDRSEAEESEGSGRKAPPPPVVPLKPVDEKGPAATPTPEPPARPAPKPEKPFIMTILSGPSMDKVAFPRKGPDDEDDTPTRTELKPTPAPRPAPPAVKPPAPAPTPAAPTPTAGGGSRTKRSR